MKNSLIALALAAALPFTASAAENLSYNYAEADYAKTDVEGIKADGWGVKGSYGFLPNFHAFGEYSRQEVDHTNIKVDQWKIGAGYNVEIAPTTDFVARVAYQKFDRSTAWTSTATALKPVSAPPSVPTPRSTAWSATKTTPRSTASIRMASGTAAWVVRSS
jgi:Ax21 family sulfation-dependent quorum factor